MKLTSKTYLLLIVILIFFVGLGAWFLSSEEDLPSFGSSQSSPRANELVSKTVELKNEITKTDKVSGDSLLEDNEEFQVKYLISSDQFVVSIKKAPYNEVKGKAEKWFLDKGFASSGLCHLQIAFIPVAKEDQTYVDRPENKIPSGCPVISPQPSSSPAT